MELNGETIQEHIPYYLTQEAKDNLVKVLQDFPRNTPYYTTRHPTAVLQGDGWSSLVLINYETGERKKVRGIILSNSCDIDPDNKRDIPAKLTFAPIVKLKHYADLLEQASVSRERIESKFESIRTQKITTLFYLPQGAGLDDESVALLDDIHSVPLMRFFEQEGRTKLFTLHNVGFYLFLLKLSIHFCRFHEELAREDQTS